MSDLQNSSGCEKVVALDAVNFAATAPYDSDLRVDSFSLGPGELALVELEGTVHRPPLGDLICGLLTPDEGRTTFRGESWDDMKPDAAASARAKIGRVFDGIGSNWLSNLDLDENFSLARRYHHGATDAAWRDRVAELAKTAGCFPPPEGRPGMIAKDVLRRAEWVRAFANDPALVILERPARNVFGAARGGIFKLAEDARRCGVAILWMATDAEEWQSAAVNPSSRWRLRDGRLSHVEMK